MSLPAHEFVKLVMGSLGAKNANALANKLGLGAAGGQRVSRWLNGDNEPDYEATMLMLKKTGWLQITAGPAVRPLLPDERTRAIAALEDLVDLLGHREESAGQ